MDWSRSGRPTAPSSLAQIDNGADIGAMIQVAESADGGENQPNSQRTRLDT